MFHNNLKFVRLLLVSLFIIGSIISPQALLAGEQPTLISLQQTNTEQTSFLSEGLSFAVFADTHIDKEASSAYIPQMAQGVMSDIPKVDFAMGLGDEVHDRVEWVGAWKEKLQQHLNLPYHYSLGDHDIVNYVGHENDTNPFPYETLQAHIRESELTTATYAMLRSNLLFLVIGDKGPIEKIHETQKEWVEYMVKTYPNKTTIIVSHAPVRGTTCASNRSDWGWRHSEMWWWELFHNNPQIKVFFNGDGHCLSYVVASNNNHEGYEGTNGDWGHEIAFIEPGSQGFFTRDDHNIDEFAVIQINDKTLTTKTFRYGPSGGTWANDFNHEWAVPGGTTYDPTVNDWYSFPLFLQDGATQILRNDVIPFGKTSLELVGMRDYSLFNNPDIIAGHISDYEKVSGFGNDNEVSFHREGKMSLTGPKIITFPDKTSYKNKEKGGKSGQIKDFLHHGSTSVGVPGKTYEVSITANASEENQDLMVFMSCSDWSSRNQYTTLEGSQQIVIDTQIGKSYETVTGTYTVPEDDRAWFLQGEIVFPDSSEYTIDRFTIKRQKADSGTRNFSLRISNKEYMKEGPLKEDQARTLDVHAEDLTDKKGNLVFQPSIGGNHVGMARLIFHAPLLFGRNGEFDVTSITNNTAKIKLLGAASIYSTTFKLLPFSHKYSTFTINPGEARTSPNGIQYGVLPITDEKQDIQIQFE